MSGLAILGLALGGAFVFEGVMWALAPGATRRTYRRILDEFGPDQLQVMGVASVAIGALLVVLCARAL